MKKYLPIKKYLPVLIIVLVVLVICLYQDGTFDKILGNSIPEEQLASDIAANNSDIVRCGLTVTDMTVLSSELDRELGIYFCEAEYIAENDEIKYSGIMSLRYMKADDTWRVTDYENCEISYEPKKAPDKSIAIEYMNAEYARLTLQKNGDYDYEVTAGDYGDDYDGFTKSYCFVFTVNGQENSAVSWTDSWTVNCVFDLRNGWKVDSAERTRRSESWDVCGTYTYSNDKVSLNVNISSFELDLPNKSATVTYSWDLIAYETNDYRWQIRPRNTKVGEGPLTVTCQLDADTWLRAGGYAMDVNAYAVIKNTLAGEQGSIYISGRNSFSYGPNGQGNGEAFGVWVKLCTYTGFNYEEYWLEKK